MNRRKKDEHEEVRKMKYVYILQVVVETDDEIMMDIHSVYTTSEKAHAIGKNLISNKQCVHYKVWRYMIYQ
jgi:hypothetical protein